MLERVVVGECVSQYSAQEPQINPQVKNTFLRKKKKKKKVSYPNFDEFFHFFFLFFFLNKWICLLAT